MDTQHLYTSKTVRGIVMGIGIAIIVLFIFTVGEWVGYRKAGFSYRHGDNYYRVFEGGPNQGFGFGMGMMRGFDDELPGGHGAVGKIVRVSLPTFVVAEPNNTEKIVVTTPDTEVRQFRDRVPLSDLKVDEYVMVLGEPDDQGQIDAKLIRIMPPPPSPIQESPASTTKSSL